ncbi:MAG: hypothetical protein KAH56_05615 [Candidatus Krumholzibacteria bacterium]|nr:hypothetical protein [Candidatus Krumholzibacteria bacterium]
MTGRNVTYCLLYESAGLLGLQNDAITFDAEKTDTLRSHFQYIAANHFDDPSYQRIDGRPVVYLYLTRTFGGTYEQALQLVRQDMLALGFDIYLIGDEVYWGTPNSTRIATFDAITAYNMHGPVHLSGFPDDSGFLTEVSAKYSQYQSTASGLNVAFIPNIMPGFNDRGVRLEVNHYVIPPQVNNWASHTSTLEVIRERLGPTAVVVPPTVFSNEIRLEGYPNPFNSRVVIQYEVAWLGDDLAGRPVASGVYFVRLETGTEAATRRISLVK